MVLLLLGLAHACQCVAGAGLQSWAPTRDATDVPTNTRVVLEAWEPTLDLLTPDGLAVSVEGVGVTVDTVDDGDHGIVFVGFDSELPAEQRVDLSLAGADAPLLSFTTGAGPDLDAPVWSGEHTASHTTEEECGGGSRVRIELDGVEADDEVAPLVLAVAVGDAGWSVVNNQSLAVDVTYLEDCGGDPAVLASGSLRYDVTVMDWAGNASETRRVASGCACSQGAVGQPAWGLLLGALLVWRRAGR